MATLTRKNIILHEIDKDAAFDWLASAKKYNELSNFESSMLRMVGDTLRERDSQHFWSNGCYCWYTDGKQDHEKCEWLTSNGNCVFEDCTKHELYNIEIQ